MKPNTLTLVIFGATGDLYQNKLSLALFNLFSAGKLPLKFKVVAFARRPLSDLEFQNFTREAISSHLHGVSASQEKIADFLSCFKYVQGDLENLESFKSLSEFLGKEDEKEGLCTNKLFYLAVPPALYETIFKNIHGAGLTIPCAAGSNDEEGAWTRVLVEKPFGEDLKTAKYLDKLLNELFDESQIFRIDHYLSYLYRGVLEQILDLRFSEKKESSESMGKIESVKIIFHEKDLIKNRGDYYDSVGAFRDVGQNHMLQMLALVAMENPKTVEIHQARTQVLEKLKISEMSPVVKGQYENYSEGKGVKPNSTTETFFRLTLLVENKEWQGVPFILEFGKGLDESQASIEVCFKDSTHPTGSMSMTCLNFPVSNEHTLRDAYEKVFYDAILGDQTIFVSTGEVMAEWKLTEEVLEKLEKAPLKIYKKGSTADDIK